MGKRRGRDASGSGHRRREGSGSGARQAGARRKRGASGPRKGAPVAVVAKAEAPSDSEQVEAQQPKARVKLYKMGEFCCNIVANYVKAKRKPRSSRVSCTLTSGQRLTIVNRIWTELVLWQPYGISRLLIERIVLPTMHCVITS